MADQTGRETIAWASYIYIALYHHYFYFFFKS